METSTPRRQREGLGNPKGSSEVRHRIPTPSMSKQHGESQPVDTNLTPEFNCRKPLPSPLPACGKPS
ncbi:hypothetical protein KY290_005374 [Solanum tuberosum]|uniref:Uncharacterized protein n=1 Tax=Solanum tuberosum TaxID=4113 RepID=A0ABQ7WDZ8_SOLTU|nr:hypothetical protein KY289_005766 [Solanum tuberosum]KAH0752097.1 hypothetical protein KY285_005245 [Solanum tuberosum]KAH0778947.1 hypothetical protein KY290_005374 [Solanum tuberosum]